MDVHPGPEKRRALRRVTDADPIRRAFHENEDWYQDLVEHSHDLLCIHDLEGRLLSVSPAPARMLGYSVKEILGIPMREMVPAEFRADFDDYLNQIKTTGESRGLVAVRTRSGERRIWEYHNTLRTAGVASPIVRGIAHDVTGQKRMEKLLRKASEELLVKVCEGERTIRELKLFRALVDQSNDAIEVVDPETLRFLDVNEKACAELGYSREELLSLGVLDIDPAVTPAAIMEIKDRLQTAGSLVIESLHRRKDGITFPVEVSMKRVLLEREYVIAISRDLTERKLAEARLQASQDRYRAVHDRAPVGICWAESRTGRLIGVNPKYCEILGRTEEDLLSRNFQSLTHPDDVGGNLEKLRQLREGELQHYEMEKRYLRPDGSIRWAEVEVLAMWAKGEEPVWHMAMVQDVTERKQSEERLREYERVVEGLEEMIVVVDRDYRYVIANRAYLSYRGLEKMQAVGHRVDEVVGKELFEKKVKAKIDECFQGRVVQYEMEYEFSIAGKRHIFVSYFPIEGPTGRVDRIAAVVQDITERKRTGEALRESEKSQKLILDHLQVGVILSSVNEEQLIYQNPRFLELFGYSIEQFPTVEEWWRVAYPDPAYREWVSQEWKRRTAEAAKTQGEIEPMEVTVTCRDGSRKYVRVLAKVLGDRNFITFIDLTERKQAEEALKKSEEKFSKAFRQSPMVLTLSSTKDHHYIEVNETFERMTGWKRDEVIGRTALDIGLWAPTDKVNLATQLQAEGPLRNVEANYRMRDGSIRIGSSSAEAVEVNGELCMLAVTADITERKQAEEALRQSEENYRMFVAQVSEGIFRQEMDAPVPTNLPEDELAYHILHDCYMAECNDAQAAMYGLKSGQEFVGKRLTEVLPPDDPHNIELTREYIRSGFRIIDRESHEIDIHGNPKVFLNSMIGVVENGMLLRTWGIQRDITEKVRLEEERKLAEEALRQNVTQLQQVTEELRLAKEKLAEEKLYLEEAIDTELGFGEIIGRSGALKEVMAKAAKVAPSDATVLLLGETGTGKELVARAIHRMSNRRENSFIKLNCAAIPSGLLESELFGHEKGAFTGAVAKKLGRLELADGGTLFLDEIGEIPLDLQPKLLRVVQDQEFERLGGTRTLKVNFRLLAATNRDLLQNVRQHEFRSDLYYRLNVFPIRIPPLRERREDIRLLIEHFVRKYASRMNKSITSIPVKTIEMLVQWAWPGNIRELENFMERSVILTPGSVLQAPLSELQAAVDEAKRSSSVTLRDQERERILRALRECKGRLGGPDGAAARLGLKRTTLQSKLSHLGIKPSMYRG